MPKFYKNFLKSWAQNTFSKMDFMKSIEPLKRLVKELLHLSTKLIDLRIKNKLLLNHLKNNFISALITGGEK